MDRSFGSTPLSPSSSMRGAGLDSSNSRRVFQGSSATAPYVPSFSSSSLRSSSHSEFPSPPLASPSKDIRSLETRALVQDEESLTLLRSQLPQITQMKTDLERKDKIIGDLRMQVAELSQYKEQSFHLRAEMSVLQEKGRLREEESRRKISEYYESLKQQEEIETTLRSQIVKLEEAMVDLKRRSNTKIADMDAEISALRTDADRREQVRSQLEQQLVSSTKTFQGQSKASSDRETAQKEINIRLQDQISTLSSIKRDLEQRTLELTAVVENQKRELKERLDSMGHMQAEIENLEHGKLQQATEIGTLRGECTHLQEKLQEAQLEANLVPDLRRELSIVPTLRLEVQKLRTDLQTADELLDRERSLRKHTEDEKRRLEEINGELERHVEEITQRYAGVKSPSAELQEKRRLVEFQNKELEHFRQSLTKVKADLERSQSETASVDQKHNQLVNELALEMTSLQRLLDSILQGADVDPQAEDAIVKFVQTETVRAPLGVVRARIVDALSEIVELRDRTRACIAELDARGSALQQKEIERSESQRELLMTRKALGDTQMAVRSLENDRATLENNADELRKEIRDLKKESAQHCEFVSNIVRKLNEGPSSSSASSALDSSMSLDAGLDLSLRSVLHGHGHAASSSSADASSHSHSWSSLQSSLSEQATSAVLTRDSLRRTVADLKIRLRDTEDHARQLQSQLTESWETAQRNKIEAERTRSSDLEELRRRMQETQDQLLSDAQSRFKAVESELNDCRSQLAAATSANRKVNLANELLNQELGESKHTAERFLAAARILARGIRPLRLRIRELNEQKIVMAKQVKTHERTVREVQEQMALLQAELAHAEGQSEGSESSSVSAPSRRSKASFRAAAIAVLAANRLLKFINASLSISPSRSFSYRFAASSSSLSSSSMEPSAPAISSSIGQSSYVGRERVTLLPASLVSDDADNIPPVEELVEQGHDAEAFMRVLAHFDAQTQSSCDEHLSRALLDSLSRGSREMQWRRTMRASSAPSSSASSVAAVDDIAAPSERILSQVRKATGVASRKIRDGERERNLLQRQVMEFNDELQRARKHIGDLEDSLTKKEELLNFLDSRVQQLQSENMTLVQPDKYDALRREYEDMSTRFTASQLEKDKLRRELDGKISSVSELRTSLQQVQDQLAESNIQADRLAHEVKEKSDELASMMGYMKRKAQEMVTLEEEKKQESGRLLETRGELKKVHSENTNLQAHLRAAEKELEHLRSTSSRLEVVCSEIEHKLSESEDRSSKLMQELKRRERELSSSQEMVKTLSEAHARSSRDAAELERSLTSTRQQLSSTRKELDHSREKEEHDLRERQEWARARLEMLNMRSAAESDLRHALEPNPLVPSSVSSSRPVVQSSSSSSSAASSAPLDDIRHYISSLDSKLAQVENSASSASPVRHTSAPALSSSNFRDIPRFTSPSRY